MNIDDWYELMKFIINKNQQGYLPPAKFNIVINQGSRSYQSFLLGSFQQYTPGRPVARVELGNNRTVRQRLAPVIYGYVLSVSSSTGKSPYPGDFLQVDSMYSIYGVKRIRYAEQTKLDAYYNSVIDPIATNPIYLIEDTNFQFYPSNIYQAKLSYVRDAPEMLWAYTLDGNGRPVYDEANSIQPVWDNIAMYDILCRALAIVGINLQSQQVIAYSQEIKTQGQ